VSQSCDPSQQAKWSTNRIMAITFPCDSANLLICCALLLSHILQWLLMAYKTHSGSLEFDLCLPVLFPITFCFVVHSSLCPHHNAHISQPQFQLYLWFSPHSTPASSSYLRATPAPQASLCFTFFCPLVRFCLGSPSSWRVPDTALLPQTGGSTYFLGHFVSASKLFDPCLFLCFLGDCEILEWIITLNE
jgi:hypothetical protein